MLIKKLGLSCLLLWALSVNATAQKKHTPLPHGMIFGSRPSTVSLIKASQLSTYMARRARMSAAIVGVVEKVTHPKGGWFTMKAGKGKTILARFKDYRVTLPTDLQGREVIISGQVTKQFNAFDSQREAGDQSRNISKPGTSQPILFEVDGLMVNK